MQQRTLSRTGQAGFSMVELLLAAFIMAVGILGLTALQVMALRASSSSQSAATAIKIGEQVVEQIQLEGRARLLYARNSLTPGTSTYFSANTTLSYFFNFQGAQQNITAANTGTFYTVTVERSDLSTTAASGQGMKNFNITVSFTSAVDPSDATKVIKRNISLTRQVAYANA